ncbi:MAG: hypothetical protein AAGG68_26950 [Bacteroidota bacterium]
MNVNGTKARAAIMNGKLFGFHLYYEINEDGRREYTVVGNFAFKKGNIRAEEVSVTSSLNDDTIELLFNVYVDNSKDKKVVPFVEEIGELDIDEENGIIERYLVIHSAAKSGPDKKPKGKVFTGSAKPRI